MKSESSKFAVKITALLVILTLGVYGIHTAQSALTSPIAVAQLQHDAQIKQAQLQYDTTVQSAAASACTGSTAVDDCVAGATGNERIIKIRTCARAADIQKCILEVTGQYTTEQALELQHVQLAAKANDQTARIAACRALFSSTDRTSCLAQSFRLAACQVLSAPEQSDCVTRFNEFGN